ncbi:hypothetical protein [Brevibacillus fortis]|uniref:hypothetical protein n=1 Tax=Brevibacillus fortis TaxID=2126352 RepID=UPI001FC96223|nr:hypothetical protein [Brevibacillus fortis]
MWVTWHGIRDDGWDAWECTIFRNEGDYLSSHLVVMALGITRHLWGEPTKDGIITYVGKHLRGGCFHAAGLHKAGYSKNGKLLLQLHADRFPPMMQPAENGLLRHEAIVINLTLRE